MYRRKNPYVARSLNSGNLSTVDSFQMGCILHRLHVTSCIRAADRLATGKFIGKSIGI